MSHFCFDCNFEIYKGKNDKICTGNDVVWHFVNKLSKDRFWFIYCDRFFSSISLAIRLWNNCMYITGTLRKNGKDIPTSFIEETKKLKKCELLDNVTTANFTSIHT